MGTKIIESEGWDQEFWYNRVISAGESGDETSGYRKYEICCVSCSKYPASCSHIICGFE
jgi:hypothetical protein